MQRAASAAFNRIRTTRESARMASTMTETPWTYQGPQPDFTLAKLKFQVPLQEPSWVNINSKSDGSTDSNFEEEDRETKICNLRTTKEKIGIDITGFDVQRIPSKFAENYKNFEDEAAIKSTYYPEIEELIKKATGGREVFIFDHTIRRRQPPGVADDSPDKRQPVPRVHIDQTPFAAEQRVKRHLGDRADALLTKRYQLINVWRPIQHAAEDMPLAVASYRTIDPKRDLVATQLIYPPPTPNGETYNVLYNQAQKFYYTKAQTPEEVTFIKCFDSDGSVAGLTPHTAFVDPNSDPSAPMRQSIEVRCLVFHD